MTTVPTAIERLFPLTRRRLLAGAGLSVTALALPKRGFGEERTPDGYRVLHARPGEARLRGKQARAMPIWGYDGMSPGPTLRVKQGDDSVALVPEYYHRFAVAMLIDKRFDLLLDFEPLLPKDLRRIAPKAAKGKTRTVVKADEDEGELTAATRLIKRVKQTFPWLDVVVGDALYANGPFLTTVMKLGLGAVIIARKEGDEPLKEALQVWGHQPPHKIIEDEAARESIELWDCPELETLQSYQGKIRCVRGRVTRLTRPDKPPSTWCMLVVGKALRLPPEKVLAVARARWHIENTGFHQWTTRWQFDHVFTHHANGICALFWLFFAAFNILTLFLYCQLRSYGRDRGKDVTRTISRLVDQMLDDLVRLGDGVWDTG